MSIKKDIEYIIDNNKCWICISHKPDNKGYPRKWFNGSPTRISKIILEAKLNRKIKKGYQTCHKCNNKLCINPDHLYEGTPKQNIQDSIKAGVHHKRSKGTRVFQGNHKLSVKEVLVIRSSKLSTKDLSLKYGVSNSYINAIKNKTKGLWADYNQTQNKGV